MLGIPAEASGVRPLMLTALPLQQNELGSSRMFWLACCRRTFGSRPSSVRMRGLSELRPGTPVGPDTCLIVNLFRAIPMIQPVVPRARQIEAFTEKLLPSVFAIRSRRVGGGLRTLRIPGIFLSMRGIHAGRGRAKDLPHFILHAKIGHMQVDRSRI